MVLLLWLSSYIQYIIAEITMSLYAPDINVYLNKPTQFLFSNATHIPTVTAGLQPAPLTICQLLAQPRRGDHNMHSAPRPAPLHTRERWSTLAPRLADFYPPS